jgi:hypothetical protein
MKSLERINDSLFRPLNTDEAAMVLGGAEYYHTFVRHGDGSMSYLGPDMVVEEPRAVDHQIA